MNNLFNKKTIIVSIIEIIITLIYLIVYGFDLTIKYCNAFFISGFTIFACGVFSWLSNCGAFDIFSYSWKTVKSSFSKSPREYKTMYDYTESKSEIRTKNKLNFLPYFLCGGIGIVISVVISLFI